MALDDKSLEMLRHELRVMKPRQALYELVKAEMQARGRWKGLPRGKGFKKGQDERRGGATQL